MKSIPSFIKSGIYLCFFILSFFSFESAAQPKMDVSLVSRIDNGNLILTIQGRRTSTTFNLGRSYFVLRVDTAVLDVFKAGIITEGKWSSLTSKDYNRMFSNYDQSSEVYYLAVTKSSTAGSFGGLPVSTSFETIAEISFPIKKCFDKSDIALSGKYDDYVSTWNSSNNVELSLYGLASTPPCTPPDGGLSMSTSQTICPGELVTFTASVKSGVADSIIFYVNKKPVQRRTSAGNTFTTNGLKDGDEVYADLKYCTCSNSTNSIKVNLLGSGSVNLGNDTLLCPGSAVTLNANPEGKLSGVNYKWSTGAVTPTLFVNSPGVYTVTVFKKLCSAEDAVSVRYLNDLAEKPKVSVENVSQNTIKFSWPSVANASGYQVSRDGISFFNPSGTNSHTFTGLAPLSAECIYVRAFNSCDTVVSARVCATAMRANMCGVARPVRTPARSSLATATAFSIFSSASNSVSSITTAPRSPAPTRPPSRGC